MVGDNADSNGDLEIKRTFISLAVPSTAAYTYTESPPLEQIATSVTLTEVNAFTLIRASVTITGGTFPGDGDVISANTTGVAITAIYHSANEQLLLTGTDTLADYRAVLQSVAFATTSPNPTDSGAHPTRTVTWVAYDGLNSSTPATTSVNIIALVRALSGGSSPLGTSTTLVVRCRGRVCLTMNQRPP